MDSLELSNPTEPKRNKEIMKTEKTAPNPSNITAVESILIFIFICYFSKFLVSYLRLHIYLFFR